MTPKGRFIERFSLHVFYTAAFGGAWVLLDPKLTYIDGIFTFIIGSAPFAAEIRGAVVTAGILATVAAVVALWFGVKQENARATDPPSSSPSSTTTSTTTETKA